MRFLFFKKIVCYILVFCVGLFCFYFVFKVIQKKNYPLDYKELVMEYSMLYGVDYRLVFATIKVESNFDKNAVSSAGAIGLMQITEKTGKYLAEKLNEQRYDLKNPKDNIKFGCYYLSYLIKRFKNIDTAVCAYNAGEGNVSLWLRNSNYSDDGVSLKLVPFSESREYLKKIKKTFEKYSKLYENILDK